MARPGKAQTCPRRMGEFGPWSREEGQDTWMPGRSLGRREAVGLSCSFCGSLHPDRFMELVREGWIVGPTDKNYKAYLGRAATAEEKAQRKTDWLDSLTTRMAASVAERSAKTPEQIRAELAEAYDRDHAGPEPCGQEAKFYFQHLSVEQQQEFIELHNAHRMKIGYPGRFYVWPFFAAPASS